VFDLLERIRELLAEQLAEMPCTVKTAVYQKIIAENLKHNKMVLVMPVRTAWTRTSKGRLKREFTVAIILITRDDGSLVDYGYFDNLLNDWAIQFVIGTDDEADTGENNLEGFNCMGVTTLDNAEVGFIIDSIMKTPSTYIGGLKLTFWK
jgi:hypothetical protein